MTLGTSRTEVAGGVVAVLVLLAAAFFVAKRAIVALWGLVDRWRDR